MIRALRVLAIGFLSLFTLAVWTHGSEGQLHREAPKAIAMAS